MENKPEETCEEIIARIRAAHPDMDDNTFNHYLNMFRDNHETYKALEKEMEDYKQQVHEDYSEDYTEEEILNDLSKLPRCTPEFYEKLILKTHVISNPKNLEVSGKEIDCFGHRIKLWEDPAINTEKLKELIENGYLPLPKEELQKPKINLLKKLKNKFKQKDKRSR